MWLMYEQPGVEFEGLALRFMDIRKRVYDVPTLGLKADLVRESVWCGCVMCVGV